MATQIQLDRTDRTSTVLLFYLSKGDCRITTILFRVSLTLAICRALAHERAYSTTMDMNSMEPAGGLLSDYFTAAARRVVIPPNAKQYRSWGD